MLLRLRDPTEGEVRINGVSSRDYKLSSWYRHVSLVPQDPRLFHTTVGENIKKFAPETRGRSLEELEDDFRTHDAAHFVHEAPVGVHGG